MYRCLSLVSVVGFACLVGCATGPADTTPDEALNDANNPTVQPDLLAGMSVIALEAGSFYMGSDVSDPDRSVDEELHLVEIASAFEMAETEVTREQFVEYMGYDPVEIWTPDDEAIVDCMDCPIQSVSWHEAAAFANALSVANSLEECFACGGVDSDVFCTVAVNPYDCEGYPCLPRLSGSTRHAPWTRPPTRARTRPRKWPGTSPIRTGRCTRWP
jgi:hypothetical protein